MHNEGQVIPLMITMTTSGIEPLLLAVEIFRDRTGLDRMNMAYASDVNEEMRPVVA